MKGRIIEKGSHFGGCEHHGLVRLVGKRTGWRNQKRLACEKCRKEGREGKVLKISDHAILRWLERKFGVDRREIVEEMLTGDVAKMMALVGDGRFPQGDLEFVVRGGVLLTVLYERKIYESKTT